MPPNFASNISPREKRSDSPDVNAQLRAALSERGILKGTESSATFIPSTSHLIVSGTTRDLQRIDTLQAISTVTPVMIQAKTKILEVPTGVEVPMGVLSGEEAQRLLNDLTTNHEGHVVSAPTVVARPGTEAQIVLGGTIRQDGEAITADAQEINLSGELSGFQLESTIGTSVTSQTDGEEKFSTRQLVTTAVFTPGSWLVTTSDTPGTEGTTRYLFYNPATIDPSGAPVNTRPPSSAPSSALQATPLALPE